MKYNCEMKQEHKYPVERYCKMKLNEMKEDYILQIVKLLRKCDDISLLDLIKKLLEKSV